MRHHAYRAGASRRDVGQPRRAVAADRRTGFAILAANRLGLGPGRFKPRGRHQRCETLTHACQRPVQVDRGGSGVGKLRACVLEARVVGVLAQGQGDTEGSGRADQRCAAHLHVSNRVRCLRQRLDADEDQFMRKARLVDDDDGVAVASEGGYGLFEGHEAYCTAPREGGRARAAC